MKSLLFLSAVCATALTLSGCGSEKAPVKTEEPVVSEPEKPAVEDPIKTREQKKAIEVSANGNKYNVSVHIYPDKSLPIVIDHLKQEFYDNSVTVSVVRNTQDTVCTHKFNKKNFYHYITNTEERQKFILSGITINEDAGQNGRIVLNTQVGEPGSEAPQHFCISIPLSGGTPNIERGEVPTLENPNNTL